MAPAAPGCDTARMVASTSASSGGRDSMWLSFVLVAAVLLRLLLLASPGHGGDLHTNEGWALSSVVYGTPASYVHQDYNTMRPNYPAFSLSLFSGVGRLYAAVSPTLDRAPLLRSMMKLPGIIGDIAICVLLFIFVRKLLGGNAGLAAAALYAFHPAAVGNSAIWGQVDSLHSAFMLAFVMMCHDKRWFLAGVLLALGLLSKVQAALLGPLVIVLTLSSKESVWKLPLGVLAGSFAVLAPFATQGHLTDALNVFSSSMNFYRQTSLNAYNLWYAIFGAQSFHTNDDVVMPWLLSAHITGLALFALCAALLLFWARRGLFSPLTPPAASRARATGLLIVAAGLCLAFFVVNTQMHERYLQPFVALGLPLAFLGARWAVIYGVSTGLFTLNMMTVIGGNGWAQAILRVVPHGPWIVALVQTALLAWFLWEALLWSRTMRLSARSA